MAQPAVRYGYCSCPAGPSASTSRCGGGSSGSGGGDGGDGNNDGSSQVGASAIGWGAAMAADAGGGCPLMWPPDWALRLLASRLSAALGLSLFNFDLIVPQDQSAAACAAPALPAAASGAAPHTSAASRGDGGSANRSGGGSGGCGSSGMIVQDGDGSGSGTSGSAGALLCMVVDVNFFPGFDKAGPAAQALLGAFLGQRARAGAAARLACATACAAHGAA
jgi:hypothetical protein